MDLFVMVLKASGIGDSGENKYNYKVIAWTHEDDPYETKVVTTNQDPEFGDVLRIPQDKPASFLNLDLYSVNSTNNFQQFFIGRANTALPMKTNANEYRNVRIENLDSNGCIVTIGNLEVYIALETG